MLSFKEILSWISKVLNLELFSLGQSAFTVKGFLGLFLFLFLLFFLSSKIKKILIKNIFPKYNIEKGIADSIGTIVRYLLLIVGLVILFQTTGIDLTTFGVLLGALGVGIGFGLQGVTNNFISGLIILFERPIKVGDRVEIEGLEGDIINIAARATTILTNDNIAVIVPNSDFINKRVVNWSHNNRSVRINIPIGVSYKEDPENIRQLLISVAKQNKGILDSSEPYVRFEAYADSSLDFNLQVWTTDYSNRPRTLRSELYYSIFTIFREHGIEIPFPQRDVHIINNEKRLES